MRLKTGIWATVSIVLLTLTSPSWAFHVMQRRQIGSDMHALYSPFAIGQHLWLGGWRDDKDIPYDKVYDLSLRNARVRVGQGVKIIDRADQLQQANDFTVVRGDSRWYGYMTTNGPDNGNIGLMAYSSPDLQHWTMLQAIVRYDTFRCSGWSPSAIEKGGEIWLYFHGAPGEDCFHNFRLRLALDGHTPLGPIEVLNGLWLLNVDVAKRPGGDLVMVGDNLLAPGAEPGFHTIALLQSADGLTWVPYDGQAGTLIQMPAELIGTPHLSQVQNKTFMVYVSRLSKQVLQRWSFRE